METKQFKTKGITMAAEAALKLVEIAEDKALSPIDQKALTYSDQIKVLPPIKDQTEYLQVGTLWKIGKELLKEIDEAYDDLVKSANKLHKDLVAKKAKFYNPTEAGVKAAKKLMSDFEEEQEKIRLADQKRLEDIAKKEAEDRLLQEAEEAEAEAKRNGATPQEAAQEAEAIISEPIRVAPVVLQKTTPKVQGVVFREIWKAQVFDLRALVNAVAAGKAPIQVLRADEVFLGQQARSLKSALNLPGVRSYSERV